MSFFNGGYHLLSAGGSSSGFKSQFYHQIYLHDEQLPQELHEPLLLLFEHPHPLSSSLSVGGQNISEGNERLLKKSHTFSELSAPEQSSGMQHP